MEEAIKRVLEADLKARAKVETAEQDMSEIQDEISRAKKKIYDDSWAKAKTYVDDQKKILDQELIDDQKHGKEELVKRMTDFQNQIKTKKDEWIDEIYARCIAVDGSE